MLVNGLEGLSAVSLAVLTRAFGMSVDEVEEMLVDVRRDMADREFPLLVLLIPFRGTEG